MATQTIVTRESLQKMLNNGNAEYVKQVVGRALVILFENQTQSEQSSNVTQEDNGVGFCGSDAYSGSLGAKSFLKNHTLADWQVAKWLKIQKNGYSRITKYHAQLNAAAQKKIQKKLI